MRLLFTKMHGLGNDFMVIDGVRQSVDLTPGQIQILSSRHTGIGFDQCLVVEPSTTPEVDFFYRIYNADGSPVGQCGNGARCIARFIHQKGLSIANPIHVATTHSRLSLLVNADNTVTVNMGKPHWDPKDIPLNADAISERYTLNPPQGKPISLHALSVGNPHAVIRCENLSMISVSELGPWISLHPMFPEHINVGFMQIRTPHEILLRVVERGSGETRACGSGAVAAVAVGRQFYALKSPVSVNLPGGQLVVTWSHPEGELLLTGPAEFVYEGTLF